MKHVTAKIAAALLLLTAALTTRADGLTERLGTESHNIDSTDVATLGLAIDIKAFLKDNEYDGHVQRGYSLPGFRFTPRLTYTPLQQVRIEAGLHATVYDGANKYPAYVFHDIATWKGNQYQHGAHVLPFLRATTSLGGPSAGRRGLTTIVLGNIYGGGNHGVVLPLWNPELTLTDDPEMGAQIIAERPRWHSDVWINWQSYIFEEDTHQEAFTVGWTQHIDLARLGSDSHGGTLGMPLQLLVQHRGGEQDATDLGVQTIANAALGLDYRWTPARPVFVTAIEAEATALACLQQSGHLWPFDSGAAAWAGLRVEMLRELRIGIGAFHAPKQFCSMYGNPFFGTISLKRKGHVFDSMTAGYWLVEYAKNLHGLCTVGLKADGYINVCGHMRPRTDIPVAEPQEQASHVRTPYSFGLYFRSNLDFWLKRFR